MVDSKWLLGGVGAAAVAGALLLRRAALPKGPERRGWDKLVFGHRGCRFVKNTIENTLPAYEYALNKGADGIEIDVRLCATGELVVFHDAMTSGQALGPARVSSDLTFAEIQALTFKEPSVPEAHPPTLEAVLQLCIKKNKKLLLEIKHYSWFDIEKVIAELDKFVRGGFADFLYHDCTIISFNPYLCYRIRKANPRFAVCPIFDDATISGIAFGSCDVNVYRPLQYFLPYVLDRIFFWACDTWAPALMGASMVGTRLNLCSAEMCNRHTAKGRLVYLWGLKTTLPDELRGCKVFVSCDDDHDVLKSNIRSDRPRS